MAPDSRYDIGAVDKSMTLRFWRGLSQLMEARREYVFINIRENIELALPIVWLGNERDGKETRRRAIRLEWGTAAWPLNGMGDCCLASKRGLRCQQIIFVMRNYI
jgi:hypothetical protein